MPLSFKKLLSKLKRLHISRDFDPDAISFLCLINQFQGQLVTLLAKFMKSTILIPAFVKTPYPY